jgi:uncharacterized protein
MTNLLNLTHTTTSPATLRISVAVVLIVFSLYSLVRPQLAPVTAGKAADGAIGMLNGVIGGATGLAGIVVTIWCTLRGWPRDEQRAAFQPIGVGMFLMTGLWLGGMGLVGAETLQLFVIDRPCCSQELGLGFGSMPGLMKPVSAKWC